MKTNVDKKFAIPGERTELEATVEQGRQLHDRAVFELFARMFGFMKRAEPNTFQNSVHTTPGWVNPK